MIDLFQILFCRVHLTRPDHNLPLCVIYHVNQLDDAGREEAVRLRAEERGLKLSKQARQFLLHHSERDLKSLMSLLARLDTRSLQEQKRLSVAMVKRELDLGEQ